MIHPKAIVDAPDDVGPDTDVWAFAHLMAGSRVGARCNIGEHVFVESGATVGDNATIKNHVLLWDGVSLEDDVFVGPHVTFTNDRFPRSPRMPEAQGRYRAKANWLVRTVVRRGCTIGAGAVICPGLELGRYAMIAAGSVVTQDVAPHSLVVGSPARHTAFVCRCGQKLSRPDPFVGCPACGVSSTARGELSRAAAPTTRQADAPSQEAMR